MTEHMQLTTVGDMETALRDLAAAIDWPATPDLVTSVTPRTATARRRSGRPLGWLFKPTLTRAVLLAGLLALLVAGAAVGIRYGLQLLQIDFGPVPTLSPPTPGQGSTLGLGSLGTLESVRAGAAFPVVVPADPGTPDEAYLGGENVRGQVAFVYATRDGLPPSELLNGAGLLFTQNRGSIDAGLARKVINAGGAVDAVMVGDSLAYWITGNPHGFWYLAPDGDAIFESGRIVGDTLVWQRDDILYRIEGGVTLERAIRIAESIP